MSGNNTLEDTAKALYQNVRAGFIIQGTTLTEWCRENGTHIQNVRDAMFGKWQGEKATLLKDRVMQAAKVTA